MGATASVGASPGIEHEELVKLPAGSALVYVTCIDYGPSHARQQRIENLEDFLARHRPEWPTERWINVDGLSDMGVIHALATKYELHPLAVENLLHQGSGPRSRPTGATMLQGGPGPLGVPGCLSLCA